MWRESGVDRRPIELQQALPQTSKIATIAGTTKPFAALANRPAQTVAASRRSAIFAICISTCWLPFMAACLLCLLLAAGCAAAGWRLGPLCRSTSNPCWGWHHVQRIHHHRRPTLCMMIDGWPSVLPRSQGPPCTAVHGSVIQPGPASGSVGSSCPQCSLLERLAEAACSECVGPQPRGGFRLLTSDSIASNGRQAA